MAQIFQSTKWLKFDGKRFFWHGHTTSKKLAGQIADRIRNQGWMARVVSENSEFGPAWAIYIRKGR